jgi:hypothetical protein
MHSPPITPASTRSRDAVEVTAKGAPLHKVDADVDPAAVTPQISPPGTSPSTTNVDTSRPPSSGQATRATSQATESTGAQSKHHGAFSIGPYTSSVPASREQSPSRSGAPTSAAPTYSRPFTPAGDANDPYAAHKRPPQSRNLDAIDPRFKFTALGSKHRSTTSSSSTSLPRSSRSAVDVKSTTEKRSSHIFGGNHNLSHLNDSSDATLHKQHGSMSELKRFLKIGGSHKVKRTASPTPSANYLLTITMD